MLGNATAFIGSALTLNSQLRVADNTATLPSYSFSNDTNTGLYRGGNDSIGISTSGALRMTVGHSEVISTLRVVVQPTTTNQRAILRLEADGNSNVQTFIGRAYMVGSDINATRIIVQRDAGNSLVSVSEARSGCGVTNRNLMFTEQDDGRIGVGEGNYSLFGLLDLGAMDNQFTKLPNPTNNNGCMLNIKSSTYQMANAFTLSYVATETIGRITYTDNVASSTIATGSSLQIVGEPAGGTNVSITHPYALYVVSGNSWINGQIQGNSGRALLPQYSLTTDNDSGLYSAGSDNVSISTGGVQWLTVGNANTIISTITSLTNTTPSTSTTTDALVVSGGVGIAGNLNVGRVLTGSSSFAEGNVTTPSIRFTNDTNTRIFRLGSDNIAISADGSVCFNVASKIANTNSFGDAVIFNNIPSYHLANAQLVFNYQSININSTALNDTSATVLGSIVGNPLITNIGFFFVSNNDTFVNAQQDSWIIFAAHPFKLIVPDPEHCL